MRVGLYGGSFDPVHSGHIVPVLEAQRQLGLERVIYLPTARPPHKPDRALASPHARFAMVELAVLEYPSLLVSPFELTPGEPAFTLHTARHFASVHPSAELFLLIGGDSFRELESWHRWRDLVDLCRLAILNRPGWERDRVTEKLAPDLTRLLESRRAVFVDNDPVDVSSTRLRQRLERREPISQSEVPDLVIQYIEKYELYS